MMDPLLLGAAGLAGFGLGVVAGGYAVAKKARLLRKSLSDCERAVHELQKLLRFYRAVLNDNGGGNE